MSRFFVGTAAWSIPRVAAAEFAGAGSHLQRYAQTFRGVEINTSFYRDHKPATYGRWAEAVPHDFRFSVKFAKEISHVRKLDVTRPEVESKIRPLLELKQKLGVVLIQLPPKLAYDPKIAPIFFEHLRSVYHGPVALEPRHPSWVLGGGAETFKIFDLACVIADPAPIAPPPELSLAPSKNLAYLRLHGSPEIYKSQYEPARIATWTQTLIRLADGGAENVWCIFDNTTFGFATLDALALMAELR